VLAATGGKEAIAMFAAAPVVDMVLAAATMTPMNGERLVARLKRMRSYVPMTIMGESGDKPSDEFAGDRWVSRSTAPAVLLDLAKVMCARKRGPRKGAWRQIVAEISLVST
jgi:CheY-like chemotaxis protein